MAALETEIDRIEGWVRGKSTHTTAGGEGNPQPAEVAFLRQQLEALQRSVVQQVAPSAPIFTYAYRCRSKTVMINVVK